ncbi:hypothetical protein SLA2020_264010 [Shorea laevis]
MAADLFWWPSLLFWRPSCCCWTCSGNHHVAGGFVRQPQHGHGTCSGNHQWVPDLNWGHRVAAAPLLVLEATTRPLCHRRTCLEASLQ